jgi:hypothetical protein
LVFGIAWQIWNFALPAFADESKSLTIYPGPSGEVASTDFEVTVNSKTVYVYRAKVRYKYNDIYLYEPGATAQEASIAYFDFRGSVTVSVVAARPFRNVSIRPLSSRINPKVSGKTLTFTLSRPCQLSILLDNQIDRPLHLFANPIEENPPSANDPNVIYFGPGIHKTGIIRLKSGQTLYIAGGAVVKGVVMPDEIWHTYPWPPSPKTIVRCVDTPLIDISDVHDVVIRGRGILDGSEIPHLTKELITCTNASNIKIEGIIIRDSPDWALKFLLSKDIEVSNVKEISGRLNSDGIDSVNSQDVNIHDCFIRNHDDSIVAKATDTQRECKNITVERCVVWNDWGYALGVTYETRAPISNVTFRNCDVIHSRYAALGVNISDSATVSNISFRGIRVEDCENKLIRMWIGSDVWGHDPNRGQIKHVSFYNVSVVSGPNPQSEILGFDNTHLIEDVRIEKLRIHGMQINNKTQGNFQNNAFVRGLRFN